MIDAKFPKNTNLEKKILVIKIFIRSLKKRMINNSLAKKFTPTSIIKFAMPNIIMMVFLSIYTIVDGMFISNMVGELALSAVNMFYPVTSVLIAIGVMFGTGGSAFVALELGKGETEKAREDFSFLTLTTLVIGILATAFLIPNLDFLIKILNVSSLQIESFLSYAEVLLWFTPALLLQTFFQIFLVTAGKPSLGLSLTVLGGVANIVLDYVFILLLDLGVFGAGLATGIGYSVTAIPGVLYFIFDKEGTLYFVKFALRIKMLFKSCLNGSSEMISNIAMAVTTFLFNVVFMHFWAENGVAAITILSYFQFVFSAVFMGFSMGVSPIISYKYGSGDKEQIKKIFSFGLLFIVLSSVFLYISSRLSLKFLLSIFTDVGSEVYNIAYSGFAIYALQFLFMGISIFSSALFTSFNNGVVSGIISFARTFLFLVAGILILPAIFDEMGVWFAVPLAELFGLVVSVCFLVWGKKKYNY